ncbi:MAG: DUF5107 domain-containing protein [Candidatus Bathyarchaeia archaeon]
MSSGDCVKISEKTATKMAYKVFEDPIPYFESKHYPYTKLNIFSSEPSPTQYREIEMENIFLKVSFIPALGARIFSALDKSSGRQIFNHIDIIRPALIAARGAWIAVGLEFNLCSFPSHTVDNFSPVDYILRKNSDGSASIILGSLNLTTNVEYAVIIKLKPNSSRIETEIRTFNTSLLPERYYFWSNAALPASQGSIIFYPGSRTNLGSFPINDEGVDLRWYKNYVRPTSLFILDSEEDFFAAYNYDYNLGLVHVANHNVVPGKKFWTWGVSEDGLFWRDMLSDKGIPYIEIQSGRFLTQGIVELANPLRFESWIEYWYPVRGLSSLTFANESAALAVEKTEEGKIRVEISSAMEYRNVKLEILDVEKRVVYSETLNLSPSFAVVREIGVKAEKPFLRILSEEGREIISWDFRSYRTSLPETPMWKGEMEEWGWKDSAEELWLKGVDSFKKEHAEIARSFFQKSLEKDPDFSKSLSWLGLLYYASGLYEDAEILLRRALRRNPYDEDARYYLCLALMALGKNEDAERNLWKIYTFGKNRSLALYLLGVLKARSNLYDESEEFLRMAIEDNGFNLRALTLLSAILRREGKMKEALEFLEKGGALMPLDYMVIAERHLLSCDKELDEILFSNAHKVLEVSKEYIFAGLFDDAAKILDEALNRGVRNPLIYYYLGFTLKKMGRVEEAKKYYSDGEKENVEYVFPHRLMDIEVLGDVISSLKRCRVARYLLGNVLFYVGRWEEALKIWEEASKNGLEHAVLYRNIGFSYSILTGEWDKSIKAYKRAIGLSPTNHVLYAELDDIYSRIGLFNERLNLLEGAPAEAKRYALIARLCSAYVDAEEEDEALKILLNTYFEPSEGYFGFWEIYTDALLSKGLKMLRENRAKEALELFIKATEYPKNLGVGAPHPKYRHDILQLYYAGLAYEMLGNLENAEKLWSEALQRSVDVASEHKVFQALILRKLERDSEARALLEKIISEAESRIKEIHEKIGDAKSAVARLLHYDEALAYLRYVIGVAKIVCGDTAEGLAEINESLNITKAIRHARWIKEGKISLSSTFS